MATKPQRTYNKADRIIVQHKFGFNEKDQEFIKANLKTMSILQLAQEVYQNPGIKEGDEEWRLCRNYINKLKNARPYFDFSDEHLEIIAEKGSTMKPIEMARLLFPSAVTNLTREAVTISLLYKVWGFGEEETPEVPSMSREEARGGYVPPNNFNATLGKIRSIVPECNFNLQDKTDYETECIKCVEKYLKSPRFILAVESFDRQVLRDIVEQEFIKAIWDKPDLTIDDANIYISLCRAYAEEHVISEQKTALDQRLNEVLQGEDKKFGKDLTDALTAKGKELDNCRTKIAQYQKTLTGTRENRMKLIKESNESLGKFVKIVQDERGREMMLRISEAHKLVLKEEAKRIANYSEFIAEIHGVSVEELLKL